MKTNLDDSAYFDSPVEIKIASWQRDFIENASCGFDGVVSIDGGLRKRTIAQTGVMIEASKTKMCENIAAVTAMFDGQNRMLTDCDGQVFENVRIDSFETEPLSLSGSAVRCEYKIIYTQFG
ncbi:MAG: hypothetical protein K8R02_02815 [Anaerohalosphaeraceae bacterium]|nr:hypothetical protein [Anaerohalosphaeraceae bacterium]